MFKYPALFASIASALFCVGVSAASSATLVDTVGSGTWNVLTETAGGTGGIVGPGVAPLGQVFDQNGAARLTTTNSGLSVAEIGINADFGQTSAIFQQTYGALSFAYSYYKESVVGGFALSAPALKLLFRNDSVNSGDNDVQFIYEPYYNLGNVAPPPNVWSTANITLSQGLFWNNGGLGIIGDGGATPKTLAAWWADLQSNPDFAGSRLVQILIGVGDSNPLQIGYFDGVMISGTASNAGAYDFGVVPLPGAAPLLLTALGGLGFLRICRRRRLRPQYP